MKPKISFIFVNYNTSQLLQRAFASLENCQTPHEIIVVDNASTDNSTVIIRQNFPKIHLIANRQNLGYGVALNQGAKCAKGEWLFLLNSDIVMEKETVLKLLDFTQENKKAAVIGPQLTGQDGKIQASAHFNPPSLLNCFYEVFLLELIFSITLPNWRYPSQFTANLNQLGRIQEVPSLIGAALFVKKEVFEKVKGFDENFFFYREESDFLWRVKIAGYKIFYYPKARVLHWGEGSPSQLEKCEKYNRLFSARYLFQQKHYGQFLTFLLHCNDLLGSILTLPCLFVWDILPIKKGERIVKGLIEWRLQCLRWHILKI